MTVSREIKTAVLVLASIALFIWGYSFLKGSDILSSNKFLYVEYDNVEGLVASSPVTINGFAVGKIKSIKLNPQTAKLLVEIEIINKEFPISKSSIANIYEPSLIGSKQIQIIPNLEDKSLTESGDHLKGGTVPGLTTMVGDKLAPIQEKLNKIMSELDTTLVSVNKILNKQTQQNLQHTIAELDQTMVQFHKASKSLNGILDNNKGKIDNVMTNFDKVSQDFSKISASLEKAQLDQAVADLKGTLAKVNGLMAQMEKGDGTLGKLIHDDKLYLNLAKASKELELLLEDVRLNPTRYVNISVFGKKNKPYIAPQTDSIP